MVKNLNGVVRNYVGLEGQLQDELSYELALTAGQQTGLANLVDRGHAARFRVAVAVEGRVQENVAHMIRHNWSKDI